jgi:hypothetical protein
MENQNFLFDSIKYDSPHQIENFIDSLDEKQSFYVLTKASEMAYSRGVFSLQESEILSKSLRILSSQYLKNDDRTDKERNDLEDN